MTAEKRRQYGTGSVYQRSSDGRWIGRILVGWTARGTRRFITVSCGAELGEAECKRRLKRKQDEITKHGVPTTAGSNITVKTWADTWLNLVVREVRPKTYANHRTSVTRWIVPTIGAKRLDALTPGDIRSVSTAIRAAGNTSSTARRTHIVLTQMLKAAIIEGHQVPQRVLLVEAPGNSVNDRDAIPVPDALKLLDVARSQPGGGSRWVAALLQGMRQGECLGLTRDAIDFDAGTLDVSWQLQMVPYEPAPKGTPLRNRRLRIPDGYEHRQLYGNLCLVRPKSRSGHRVIPLVPWMAAALSEWLATAQPNEYGLVWPRPNGRPEKSRDDNTAWDALQAAAGVQHPAGRPYYLHEARHTTATLLLEAGVDPEVIKAILGHSSIIASQDYKHVSQAMARKAMDQLADRLQLRLPTAGELEPHADALAG